MQESLSEKSIFVLGAGATKAFAPNAPLGEDDYGLNRLIERFRGFPHALNISEGETLHRSNGKINVEQLMTRLQGRMPYDTDDAHVQQSHLLSELMKEFRRRVALARSADVLKGELDEFARLIIENNVTCITFNYDDILDQAFWEESHRRIGNSIDGLYRKAGKKYWHPDGGYGFFVRPSEITVHDMDRYMDQTSVLLLKLHGSINWYPRSGENQPYSIDAIYHHEDWYRTHRLNPAPDRDLIARHLEEEAFLIPPVLDKTSLGNEPVLKTVWSLVKERLDSASRIYFIGYSMSVTDLAGSFLFSESIGEKVSRIKVINLAEKDDIRYREQIKAAYRTVLPTIKDDQFEFDGAIPWVRRICGVESAPEA